MTVSSSATTSLDENLDWPTQGQYEYAYLYNSRKEITAFDDIRTAKVDSTAYDYVIIGAGPIGAALAYRLAKDHPTKKILIVEKNWNEPDRIVGELMQPSGCQALEKLGLPNVFSGIGAVPAHGYFISYKGKQLYVPNMERPAMDGSRYKGVSFHHGRLVMNIRAACKAMENVTCLEASVTELLGDYESNELKHVHGVRIGPVRDSGDGPRAAEYSVYPSKLTFVCDGITSQFRKALNPAPVELISHFCGFVLEHEPIDTADFFTGPTGATTHMARPTTSKVNPLPMPHNGHVFLDGVGPLLLYQMSECETRVLADIPGSNLPSEASGQLRKVLHDSLNRSVPKHDYPGLNSLLLTTLAQSRRIRCIGTKFIPATANKINGAIWIGDSLNVRHPLTGGGMTIGLWDIVHLTDLLRTPKSINQIKAQWYWQRRPRAIVVNTLSVALHALFAAETKELAQRSASTLKRLCVEYLQRGYVDDILFKGDQPVIYPRLDNHFPVLKSLTLASSNLNLVQVFFDNRSASFDSFEHLKIHNDDVFLECAADFYAFSSKLLTALKTVTFRVDYDVFNEWCHYDEIMHNGIAFTSMIMDSASELREISIGGELEESFIENLALIPNGFAGLRIEQILDYLLDNSGYGFDQKKGVGLSLLHSCNIWRSLFIRKALADLKILLSARSEAMFEYPKWPKDAAMPDFPTNHLVKKINIVYNGRLYGNTKCDMEVFQSFLPSDSKFESVYRIDLSISLKSYSEHISRIEIPISDILVLLMAAPLLTLLDVTLKDTHPLIDGIISNELVTYVESNFANVGRNMHRIRMSYSEDGDLPTYCKAIALLVVVCPNLVYLLSRSYDVDDIREYLLRISQIKEFSKYSYNLAMSGHHRTF
ncbi:Squalene epoxidase, partial [Coemansia sp. IMI 203386]